MDLVSDKGVAPAYNRLVTLALQNAFLTIIMHYSRISTAPNRTYSAAAAVLLNELLKGVISIVIALKKIDVKLASSEAFNEKDPRTFNRPPTSRLPSYLHTSRLQNLAQQVFSPDCYKLAVPAILYVIQNNLQYVAASNLDVATFQVTYQMKILTTAFFSVLLLRKRLTQTKWLALVLLAVGVGIVQLQSTAAPAHIPGSVSTGEKELAPRAEISDSPGDPRVMRPLRGFIAVVLACLTSGLAGVYFEFILKSSAGSSPPPDLWIRNTQLSAFSLIPALVPILFGGSGQPDMGWFAGVINKFRNFNGWAIGTVLTQTFGGLITAIVIKYSDNIMWVVTSACDAALISRKGFATSLSIIISFLASVALFSYPITLSFVVGASIVLCATYIYNSPNTPSSPPSRTTVAVAPGSPISTSAPILGEPEKPSRASSVINLLGLGSNAPSRQASSTDLRNSANLGYAPTQPHVFSASAPGSPFLSSNPYSTNRSTSPQHGISNEGQGGSKPRLSVETKGQN